MPSRDSQRVSSLQRGDIVAYNLESQTLEVWRGEGESKQVLLSHVLEIRDRQYFIDLVQLIGKVAGLNCTQPEREVPEGWVAYKFLDSKI